MIAGAIVVGLALVVEFTFQPPYWVHVVLWVPLVLPGCHSASSRPLKGPDDRAAVPPQSGQGRIEGRREPDRGAIGLSPDRSGTATVVAVAILVSLGLWQLQRLQWKEALIARVI